VVIDDRLLRVIICCVTKKWTLGPRILRYHLYSALVVRRNRQQIVRQFHLQGVRGGRCNCCGCSKRHEMVAVRLGVSMCPPMKLRLSICARRTRRSEVSMLVRMTIGWLCIIRTATTSFLTGIVDAVARESRDKGAYFVETCVALENHAFCVHQRPYQVKQSKTRHARNTEFCLHSVEARDPIPQALLKTENSILEARVSKRTQKLLGTLFKFWTMMKRLKRASKHESSYF
jgi:hypothetical protein